MTKKIVNALVLTNLNGGFYECGRRYGLVKKREVALTFLELQLELSPTSAVSFHTSFGDHMHTFS